MKTEQQINEEITMNTYNLLQEDDIHLVGVYQGKIKALKWVLESIKRSDGFA